MNNPLQQAFEYHFGEYKSGNYPASAHARIRATLEILVYLLFLEISPHSLSSIKIELTTEILEWAPTYLRIPNSLLVHSYLAALQIIHLIK
jgi:hypothetical protein